MIFSKFFHLSREGTRTIMQAGIWLAVFNLAALLPVVLLAMVSESMMTKHFAGDGGNIPLLPYAAALLVILTVMFLTYKVAYHKEYLTSGQEEYKLRMELADKLRRLPLSFFGMRDLSDVTGIIMDDVQTMSHVLSQSAAELIGGILTGIVALVVLFIYDWRLALYLAVCMPVVLLVMALSRKISEGTNKKNRSKKLDVSAGLQEYLENIKLLRTTEAMGDYQQGLCKKVKRIIPGLVLYELLAGLSISISYNVMRVGLGLVILFGSGMLAAGEITLFKFLIFLYAAVRIYEPLTSACEHLGDFIASLVGRGVFLHCLLNRSRAAARTLRWIASTFASTMSALPTTTRKFCTMYPSRRSRVRLLRWWGRPAPEKARWHGLLHGSGMCRAVRYPLAALTFGKSRQRSC